jgi:hypothetical protein
LKDTSSQEGGADGGSSVAWDLHDEGLLKGFVCWWIGYRLKGQ